MSTSLLPAWRRQPTESRQPAWTVGRTFGLGMLIVVLSLAFLVVPTTARAAAVVPESVDDATSSGQSHFAYSGSSWTPCGGCNAGAFKGSFRYAYRTGDTMILTFTGSAARLYGFKEPAGGIAKVSVDGGNEIEVNFHAAKQVLTTIYTTASLTNGQHTITMTVTGRYNGGTSATINIDRAEIDAGTAPTASSTSTPPITVVPPTTSVPAAAPPATPAVASVDDAAQTGTHYFTYAGSSWTNCGGCNPGAWGGGFRYAFRTGDRMVLTFTGSRASLVGFKEPAGGIATVSVDGGAGVEVDFYAAQQKLAGIYATAVLANTRHTLTMTVTGRKNSGTSPTINIDRAEITGKAVVDLPATTQPPTVPPTTTQPTAGKWMSGGAGEGVGTGTFGAWRGSPVPMAVTWSDATFTDAANAWQFDAGAEYGSWAGSADWSSGAIWAGDSWAAAARGDYDARWTAILSNVEEKWTSRSRGTLFIRFAHEMNGNWFAHSVDAANIGNFKAAWLRFYSLKQSIFPAAKLVFNTNANTSGQSYDWRALWPGDRFVDVYATDWYSMHWTTGGSYDRFGGPVGLEEHRLFALQHGKPFAVPEWGNNLDVGDQPKYIQYMYDFFKANAGTGAGKLLYEGYFNVTFRPTNQFGIFPESGTLAPLAAAKYKQLF